MLSVEIGHTAGKVWDFLEKNGASTINKLKKSVDASGDMVLFAIGWLAREDKIKFEKKGRATLISLK